MGGRRWGWGAVGVPLCLEKRIIGQRLCVSAEHKNPLSDSGAQGLTDVNGTWFWTPLILSLIHI